jgi:hypothetical protein
MTDRTREHSLLATALVGALLPPDVPEGHMLRSWLDSWSGVGHVLDAMTAAGHHVELRQWVFGWRAEFYREAMQHSRATWAGVGTDPLPWRAIQMWKPFNKLPCWLTRSSRARSRPTCRSSNLGGSPSGSTSRPRRPSA